MNIKNTSKYIKWNKFYDPNFNWHNRLFYQENQLSEEFINEFADKVNWDFISIFQTLNESFIKKYKHKVNWFLISSNQILSEKFKREFKKYLK